jgi:hypothetical protein
MAELKTGNVGLEYANKKQVATTENTGIYQDMVNSSFVEERQTPDDPRLSQNKSAK